jgi:3-deoxy-manno-octulosonate cytidylyltransferase (CMP-KDO synthetase)
VLADIHGHPLLWHVFQRASQAKLADSIWIATDSEEVHEAALSWGAQSLITSPDCTCGTERIASIADKIGAELIVNVQGDEPMVEPQLIDDLIVAAQASDADMVTPVIQITDEATLSSATTVKVVRATDGQALYFSRSAVPFIRDVPREQWVERGAFWLQVGMYTFTKDVLMEYLTWPEPPLEALERVEQIRFLEHGKRIMTIETAFHSMAVDVPADLEKVRMLMVPDAR